MYIYLPQDTFYNLQQYEVRTQAVIIIVMTNVFAIGEKRSSK